MTIAAEIKPMIVPSALLASRVRVIGAGVCLVLWSLCVQAVRADDWFWVNSKINGKPARLVLDTGCEPGLALFRHSAERLNLKLRTAEIHSTNQIPYWLTDECTVKLPWSFWGFAHAKGQLTVVELPPYVEHSLNMDGVDGAVGWGLVSERVLELDAVRGKFRLTHRVSKKANGWAKLTLRKSLPWGRQLALEMPNPDGSNEVIIVDTGACGIGVALSPQKWKEWKATHPNQPTTLSGTFMVQPEVYVIERAWADQISLGPINLTAVVVEETDPASAIRLPQYAATFGVEALKRLDFIVDGKGGVAYLQPKKTTVPSPLSEQDRLVLVFVPGDAKSDDLVARVLDGSSPYDAGIRNGDVLLKIDERDVAQWRADPGEKWRVDPGNPFIVPSSNNPAGIKLELTLKRNDDLLKATIDLTEIAVLAPQTTSRP